jgi:hypothetical protein
MTATATPVAVPSGNTARSRWTLGLPPGMRSFGVRTPRGSRWLRRPAMSSADPDHPRRHAAVQQEHVDREQRTIQPPADPGLRARGRGRRADRPEGLAK